MFLNKLDRKSDLEKTRDEALSVLNDQDPFSDEYAKALEHVVTLSELHAKEAREKLNMNTVWSVGGTLVAVAAIIGHEKANVLTSKALQFLPKLLK